MFCAFHRHYFRLLVKNYRVFSARTPCANERQKFPAQKWITLVDGAFAYWFVPVWLRSFSA